VLAGTPLNQGVRCVELMATMAGEPLYRACGYRAIQRVVDDRGGAPVPLQRMEKDLWALYPNLRVSGNRTGRPSD
jgi:hypothetical protein